MPRIEIYEDEYATWARFYQMCRKEGAEPPEAEGRANSLTMSLRHYRTLAGNPERPAERAAATAPICSLEVDPVSGWRMA